MSAARYALLRVEEAEPHTKNWRPQLLAFINVQRNDEEEAYTIRHARILNFLYQLKAGKSPTAARVAWLSNPLLPRPGLCRGSEHFRR